MTLILSIVPLKEYLRIENTFVRSVSLSRKLCTSRRHHYGVRLIEGSSHSIVTKFGSQRQVGKGQFKEDLSELSRSVGK